MPLSARTLASLMEFWSSTKCGVAKPEPQNSLLCKGALRQCSEDWAKKAGEPLLQWGPTHLLVNKGGEKARERLTRKLFTDRKSTESCAWVFKLSKK